MMQNGAVDRPSKLVDLGLHGLMLDVTGDKIAAYLVFPQDSERPFIDSAKLLNLLQKDIGLVAINRTALMEAVDNWNEGRPCEEKILIAQGTPPINGNDSSIEWKEDYFREKEVDSNLDSIDFYNLSKIAVVTAGEHVAAITRSTKGVSGVDVYGREIQGIDGKPLPIEVGENLAVEENGTKLVAKAQGQIVLKDRKVIIKTVLNIENDVDYDVGRIDFPGTVIIRGNVLHGFSVKAGNELHVFGLVEGAYLESAGDMFLKGGASGKNKGKIICGGKLTARFLNNIDVVVQGDIEVKNEIINCNVTTKSRIILPRGSIIGGKLIATQGGEIGILGSDGFIRTRIIIGRDVDLEAQIDAANEEIKSLEEKINQIDESIKVEKYKASTVAGSPDSVQKSREAMMRLNSGLEELKAKVEGVKARKAGLWEKVKELKTAATLLVRKTIYQGVLLDIGGERKEWDKDYFHSIRIRLNPVDQEIEFVKTT